MDTGAKNSINAFLWDLQKKTGADIAVVTVKSLDGKSIEQTALDVGREFKIGEKAKIPELLYLLRLMKENYE